MSGTPTPRQALILWCLLGRHGSALQSEIVPRIEKADREALLAGRLVEAARQGRSQRLTVTDKGWNWAGAHLAAELPPNFSVLRDWLSRIGRHLEATGGTLAELVGPAPEPAEAAKPVPAKGRNQESKVPRTKSAPASRQAASKPAPKARIARTTPSQSVAGAASKKTTPKQLRARIEKAYLALTGGRRAEAVRLSALRAHLADLDRAALDAGLAAILKGDPTARLSQFTDPKALDAAERAAAYSPAGEPFHLIWIQS